jgi:hypothetical protein
MIPRTIIFVFISFSTEGESVAQLQPTALSAVAAIGTRRHRLVHFAKPDFTRRPVDASHDFDVDVVSFNRWCCRRFWPRFVLYHPVLSFLAMLDLIEMSDCCFCRVSGSHRQSLVTTCLPTPRCSLMMILPPILILILIVIITEMVEALVMDTVSIIEMMA